MRTQTKITLVVAGGLAVVLAVVVLLAARGGEERQPAASAETRGDSALIRDDSRILGEEGSTDVTFVEFLDFECEACGALYPVVEQLRKDYDGEVTFVARYFPLPSHFNSERAARAVESAARQGKFEEMYQKMFDNQASWGEQQVPLDGLFRGYAEEIGLDMTEYDADYASDAVKDRVQKDVADGESLGVEGTPTIYVDGELLQPERVEDLTSTLDDALGR